MSAARRLSERRREEMRAELAEQWPRVGFAITVRPSGYVNCDYFLIVGRMDHHDVQGVRRAEVWEELAVFYEWRLEQRADEIARDPSLRYLLVTWTDSMCYSLRRSAAFFRGEDPGPVIPQSQRIPDVYAELHARIERKYGAGRRLGGVSDQAERAADRYLVAVGVAQ